MKDAEGGSQGPNGTAGSEAIEGENEEPTDSKPNAPVKLGWVVGVQVSYMGAFV